jgi:hypothetical protein
MLELFSGYISFSALFIAPFVLGVFVVIAAFFATRHVLFGFGLALVSVFFEAYLVISPAISVGINLFVNDLVPSFLFAIALIRINWVALRIRSTPTFLVLIALFCILMLSLAIGFTRYGQAAGNDFRGFFYVLAGVTYMASFPRDQLNLSRIENLWIFTAACLCVLAVIRWILDASGVLIGPDWHQRVAGGGLRVLTSDYAFLISSAVLLLNARMARRGPSPFPMILSLAMLGCVVVLQHRSVWVASLVGIVVMHVLQGPAQRARLKKIYIYYAILLVLFSPIIIYGGIGSILDSLQHSISEVSARKSTISGRAQGWMVLLEDWRGFSLMEKLFGQPFGAGYERYLADYGRVVRDTPHNYYIQVFLRGGIVGILLFVGVIFLFIREGKRLFSATATRHLGAVALTLITMNGVYWVVYQARFQDWLLLGACIGWSALSEAGLTTEQQTGTRHAKWQAAQTSGA